MAGWRKDGCVAKQGEGIGMDKGDIERGENRRMEDRQINEQVNEWKE